MTIGENIKRIRKEKHLTQKALGDLCGINEANIRKYELGGANPKLETIKKIASGLGVDYEELLVDTKHEPIKIPRLQDLIKNQPWQPLQNQSESSDELYKKLLSEVIESSAVALDPEELSLVELFRKLNELGQDKAIEQVELLTKIPEYQNQD